VAAPLTALANAGRDTRALRDWLGHRSIQHTVRYIELSPSQFKDYWRKLDIAKLIDYFNQTNYNDAAGERA
jgi:site-specific recombinase XerD